MNFKMEQINSNSAKRQASEGSVSVSEVQKSCTERDFLSNEKEKAQAQTEAAK